MSRGAPTGLETTFVQLSPDGREAGAQFAETLRDDVSPRELRRILRRLEDLAPTLDFSVQPGLRITAPAGKFVIQVKAGRLTFVSWASGQHAAATPTVDDMVRIVTGEIVEGEVEPLPAPALPSIGPSRRRRGLIIALVAVVFVAVNVFTIVEARKPPGNFLPAYRLLEPEAAGRLLENVAGAYETGAQQGDRRLEITKAGVVHWIKFGAGKTAVERRELNVRAVQANGTSGLLTNRNTIIFVKGPITLSFFNDTYTRAAK